MKKLLMITALCALIVSFTGCGNGNENNDNLDSEVNSGTVVSPSPEVDKEPELQPEETKTPEQKTEETKKPVEELPENKPATKPSTKPSTVPSQTPEVKPSKEPETTLPNTTPAPEDTVISRPEPIETPNTDDDDDITNVDTELGEILDSVVKEAKIERYSLFNAKITASSSSTYVGLKQDEYSNLIEKGAANESMMMPSNYSFCLLKVKDSKNVADIKQKVFDNCNTGKWICMSAEYVLAVDSGNYVVLVMGYEDECKAIYDALKSKLGTVGETLERSVVE